MPCRAPTARLPALWITDDILAEAYNRFARVSNAHKRGRRYGSHVPGPLEAHRRSSKRRMGVAAVASSMPSPGVDLGSLFGLGGCVPQSRVDDWKWEPPGVEERADGLLDGWKKKRRKEMWETFLDVPQQEDAVEASRKAFEELLARDEDIQGLIEFLRTSANEPEAGNTLRLVEFLASHGFTEDSFCELRELLLEKIRLQTLAEGELSSVLCLVLQWEDCEQHIAEIAGLLDELPSEVELAPICVSVTKSLLVDPNSAQTLIQVWLPILRGLHHLQGEHSPNPIWRQVYDLMASSFPEFTILKDHLSTLKGLDRSRILLRHWVPLLAREEELASGEMHITVAGGWKRYTRPADCTPSVDQLLQELEELALESATRRQRIRGLTPAAQLIAILARHRIPHMKVCHGVFDILMHSFSMDSVHRAFHGITHHADIGIDNALAQTLIHYFLEKGWPQYAEHVFNTVQTLPLSACYDLPITLAKTYPFNSLRLWRFLQRLTPEDQVERPESPRNRLSQEHIDLIHLVAFYISQNEGLKSSRSAFRRVWECYLFLRDRLIHMRPMMTRALVTTGIIRPLKDLRRPSTVQLQYVLSLVRRVEGNEVADDLDRLVWKMWTENVLPKIRARGGMRQLDRFLGDEALREANEAKTRLLLATRSFRRGRFWLSPHKEREIAQTMMLYDPFPVAERGNAIEPEQAADTLTATGQVGSPFDLAEYEDHQENLHPELRARSTTVERHSHDLDNHVVSTSLFEGSAEIREPLYDPEAPSAAFLKDGESDFKVPSRRFGLGYDGVESFTPIVEVEHEVETRASPLPQTMAHEGAPEASGETLYTPMTGAQEQEEDLLTMAPESSDHDEAEAVTLPLASRVVPRVHMNVHWADRFEHEAGSSGSREGIEQEARPSERLSQTFKQSEHLRRTVDLTPQAKIRFHSVHDALSNEPQPEAASSSGESPWPDELRMESQEASVDVAPRVNSSDHTLLTSDEGELETSESHVETLRHGELGPEALETSVDDAPQLKISRTLVPAKEFEVRFAPHEGTLKLWQRSPKLQSSEHRATQEDTELVFDGSVYKPVTVARPSLQQDSLPLDSLEDWLALPLNQFDTTLQHSCDPLGAFVSSFPKSLPPTAPPTDLRLDSIDDLEHRCWTNTLSRTSNLPIHTFLRWEPLFRARYCLLLRWRGVWLRAGVAFRRMETYRAQGEIEPASQLAEMFKAACEGKAGFTPGALGLHAPDTDMKPLSGEVMKSEGGLGTVTTKQRIKWREVRGVWGGALVWKNSKRKGKVVGVIRKETSSIEAKVEAAGVGAVPIRKKAFSSRGWREARALFEISRSGDGGR